MTLPPDDARVAPQAASPPDPQAVAADPRLSAFVTANAGSGKTKTLVDRVARLLLHGAAPHAVLCVTYTKAAAAEMQRRLFSQLGDWSMAPDAELRKRLAAIGEAAAELASARRLFARALETPGGLQIQTLHAFCEKLLRRFPLEAGVSPGFAVLDDAAIVEISQAAREAVVRAAAAQPLVADAYARFAATLDFRAFEQMFATFEASREAILAYVERCSGLAGLPASIAAACGLPRLDAAEAIRTEAATPPRLDLALWRDGALALAQSGPRDRRCAEQMQGVIDAASRGEADFALAIGVFRTDGGEPARWLETARAVRDRPALQVALFAERDRLFDADARARAAQVAEDSVHALTLAYVYAQGFAAAKAQRGVLDFTDLTARARDLLSRREDAAWVLYKLDGGIEHVLVDEAQDTAPEQWEILNALTTEAFSGAPARTNRARPGVRRGEGGVFVVGDEKQSIYSFQGARPERLSQEAQRYRALVEGAGLPFAEVPLLTSYRSTPQVLAFVDAAFEPAHLRQALQPRAHGAPDPGEAIRHLAQRIGHAGCIDLWPLEQEAPRETGRAWDEPLDAEATRGAYRRLAERIAVEIEALVARGDQVHDKAARGWRPAGYGDVLILVRKRGPMFQELLRALKRCGLPTAGADRLILSEHTVFEDLVALGRVLAYPPDDLSLAEVLRSPLCDVDEQGLFDLAHGRAGSLISALRRRAHERPEWAEILRLIDWAAREAEARAPFDLYSRLLARLDERGRSMRQRFVTRLGPEAADALDEFLAQALACEGRGINDLERLLDALSRLQLTVRREMDEPRGEVRVMTAHSAKGLEAPIVFLPDTVLAGAVRGSPLLETPDGGFLWCASKAGDCEASAQVRALRAEHEAREGLRLLYVALTRARDRLVIAGRIHARADPQKLKGWWPALCAAFDHPAIAGEVREISCGEMTIRRFGADPIRRSGVLAALDSPPQAPDWTRGFAPGEAEALRAAPSRIGDEGRGAATSPLAAADGLGRFRRGALIHRLLQLLPDLAPETRAAAAARMLARERDLTPAQRAEMAAAALGVLGDPQFEAVFAPGSRAEAAVAGSAPGLPPGLAISGRVDRLRVTPDRVLVVDFKTNRPAPARIEDADPAYIDQMAVYAAVLASVFPGRTIEAALVWTDGPKLTPIPDKLIAASLSRLHPQA